MILKMILAALLIVASAILVANREQSQMLRPPTRQEQKAAQGFQHDWNADTKRRMP